MLKRLLSTISAVLVGIPLALMPVPVSAATSVSITSPSSGATVTGSSFTVTGTATAKRKITIKVNGTTVGTTTSDASGNWSLSVTGQVVGAKTIEATASVGYAYVANYGDSTISVINTVTDEKIGSNISSSVAQNNVVVSPDGTQMVTVSGFGGNAIKVWSLANPEVPVITHNLTSTGAHATAVNYTPNGTYFYVTSEAGDFSSGTVTRYNSADPTVNAAVTGYNQNFPAYPTFNSDSTRLYVGNVISSTMSVINVTTNTQLSTFASSGGGGPLMSDDIHGYSQNNTTDAVYPYNVQSGTTGSAISVGDGPLGMAYNQDQSRLIVANSGSDNLSVINTGTNTVVDTVSTGTGSAPYAMAFDNSFSKLYVTENGQDRLSIRDPSTFAATGSYITVGDGPRTIAMGPTESASTAVSFTLAAASSSTGLADTGDSASTALYVAFALIASGIGGAYILRRQNKLL